MQGCRGCVRNPPTWSNAGNNQHMHYMHACQQQGNRAKGTGRGEQYRAAQSSWHLRATPGFLYACQTQGKGAGRGRQQSPALPPGGKQHTYRRTKAAPTTAASRGVRDIQPICLRGLPDGTASRGACRPDGPMAHHGGQLAHTFIKDATSKPCALLHGHTQARPQDNHNNNDKSSVLTPIKGGMAMHGSFWTVYRHPRRQAGGPGGTPRPASMRAPATNAWPGHARPIGQQLPSKSRLGRFSIQVPLMSRG